MTVGGQEAARTRRSPVVPIEPSAALVALAAELREEGPVIAPHVAEPTAAPALGLLAAAGPRCAEAPAAYAAVIESVREGYLLHYGEPRLLAALDADLRLLIGDHLYARGIERLVALGDLLAVRVLSDLISLAAQLDAAPARSAAAAEAAWLASVVAIAVGADEEHERGRAALRAQGDARPLWDAAVSAADRAGLSGTLASTAQAVGFSAADLG
jgi:hypothetical protein